ncbi:glycosyl hydrolase family 28-related protein [Asticcacaulis sp. BYS171W]|uniref:Glycosyl hydrolase family 28-related protein n=1 Tax=Asticcacaulis aquaticus TaxID=2984212 RepID=A0ABT5HVT4_9CAUL|nr:glycosyl hydrolase family 28-related protein [Asticcacaulis aquaticus]MDC7684154.1 glycosyl hydrolase family 28-related protein [Asticcacaulis aquaticus]
MTLDRRQLALSLVTTLAVAPSLVRAATSAFFDVKTFGARGDGKAIDSDAINKAILAAYKAGGGTVVVPAGRYLCFSLRLKDRVTLLLSPGCVIEAADTAVHGRKYDLAEQELLEQFQDYGITHAHPALIYADGAVDIAIVGQGLFYGKGLVREGPNARWKGVKDWKSATELGLSLRDARRQNPAEVAMDGLAHRTVSLKNCRNVVLRDFMVLQGGHFSVFANNCDNVTIDNLLIDTNRDGIDIDGCRNVKVVNCKVNSPRDDAIVLKSSYSQGRKIFCENILISGCTTSAFGMGMVFEGTLPKLPEGQPYNNPGALGRIKIGTESNGGFRNIQITDCLCDHSRGILIGVVDGGLMEDVTISNITLRNPVNHPLFVRHAARLRAPEGTGIGAIRRIRFSDITVTGVQSKFACGVEGIPDGIIEDVSFSHLHITARGGGTTEEAALNPAEKRVASLEVNHMAPLPAYGLFARFARNVTVRDSTFDTETPDARPAIVFDRVTGGVVEGLRSVRDPKEAVVLRDCRDISVEGVTRIS